MRRPLLAVLLAVATIAGTGACKADTVRVTFRPVAGAKYGYEMHIRSTTTVELGDARPTREEDETVLRSEHEVLEAGEDGVRVRVRLLRRGSDPREFVVRFDRAAQLAGVESIEGLPTSALGDIGLSEIFPAAAGAPPKRPLRPGDTWRVDEPLTVPSGDKSRLRGSGRLVELGVLDGRKVATVRSRTELPVSGTTTAQRGTLQLKGTQETESDAKHDIDDGAVERATSLTRGRYSVVLQPPPGTTGAPVKGTLTVEIRSDVRRLKR